MSYDGIDLKSIQVKFLYEDLFSKQIKLNLK